MDNTRKRKHMSTDYGRCVICQKLSSETLQKVTVKGFQSLEHAVTHRTDETAFRLQNEIQGGYEQFMSNDPLCHAKCRNSYTNKKTVAQRTKLPLGSDICETSVGICPPRPICRSSATGAIDHKKQCFICGKERTGKGEHKLLLISMPERQHSIWQKAKELGDDKMLHQIQGHGHSCVDMIANDFKYHRSCLCAYLTKICPQSKGRSDEQDESLMWLTSYIDDTLSQDPNSIIFLSSLRDKHRSWLSEHGILNIYSHRSSSIKKKIEDYYKDHEPQVMIVPQKGQSSIICSSHMSIGYLLTKVASMKEQIDTEDNAEESDDESINTGSTHERNIILYHSAKSLRTDIKATAAQLRKKRNEQGDTSVCMEITFDAATECVPVSLYNHVAWLVTDVPPQRSESNKRVELTEHEHEKVLNLAQDIGAAVASIPNPKHIGTALHVLKQTRSKEIITMMNRFGNSIGYQDAQRYITSMAQATIEEHEQDEPLIPSNLKYGLFTQCAIDNLDFHEHTPDGTTMHGTTHNIYQYSSSLDEVPTATASVPLTKKLRRASCTGIQPFHTKESGLSLRDRQHGRSLCGLSLIKEQKTSNLIADHTVVWQLLQNECLQTEDCKSIITWNAFHELCMVSKQPQTLIGYGPFFPESPTNPDVVESSVEYCITTTKKLGQQYCIITCDQAIYEITLGLQKKKPDKYEHLILRMGGFHIANNFMGALGCLFKSSGIEAVVVEAKVFRAGTMNKLMSGKDYYAMVRCHSLMLSTMLELYWEAFESWTLNEPNVNLDVMATLSGVTEKLANAVTHQDTAAALQAHKEMVSLGDDVQLLLAEFNKTFCNSPTAKLWLMYIDMVLILKRYVAAERAGCWEDHLTQVETMLPYLVSAGHIKYVSCIPHYLVAMRNLPPDIDEEFQRGHFNVRVARGKFNAVWTDMALEQTYNRDAKTQLFKGVTQQASTRDKYLRALPALTAVSEQTKAMVHIQEGTQLSTNTKANKERSDVNKMKRLLKQDMINPFSCSSPDLLNIATGEKCQSLDLLEAKSRGLSALERAEKNQSPQVEPVHLQTFEQKSNKQVKSQQTKIYREEINVLQSLCFIQEKDKDAFAFEWTDYPASLFEPNKDMPLGYAMRKGNKADYAAVMKDQLKDCWVEEDHLPTMDDDVLLMVDAMAFIHRNQDNGCKIFADMQARYLKKLLSTMPAHCTCISIIGDRYDIDSSKSLKADERIRRQQIKQSSRTYEIKDNLPIPQWKAFILNHKNKAALQNYLANSWTTHHKAMPQGVKLILGGLFKEADKAVVITTDGQEVLHELACGDHEEADTRIFSHINYCVAQYGYTRVVIQATDTDILILAIYYSVRIHGLKELWVQKGSTHLPCHNIAGMLADKFSLPVLLATSALLCGHIMSGCDTVSYAFGKGKKKSFKVAMMNASDLKDMMKFGDDSLVVSDAVIGSCRTFFMKLYSDFSGNLDDLRAHIFGRLKGDIRKLPPTESAFKYHMLRGLYQIAICKRSHQCVLSLPDATSFGRQLLKGHLVPIMMDKPAKPPVVKQKQHCQCSKSKCTRNCSCAIAGVSCVIACKCSGNANKCARIMEQQSDDDE